MTEQTRLISYFLCGPLSVILKKNTIKTSEVIKLALAMALFVTHNKEVSARMLVFLSVIENIVVIGTLPIFFIFFAHALVSF